MAEENPFLKLLEAEKKLSAGSSEHHTPEPAVSIDASPDQSTEEDFSEAMRRLLESEQALRDAESESSFNPASAAGNAASSVGAIAYRRAPEIAERLTGAPSGSVRSVMSIMNPKPKMTFADAAKASMQSRLPANNSAGQKWLTNWANIDRPEFVGGVPEGSQLYNRMQSHGKVTGPLGKKFGPNPNLSISGQRAAAALSAEEAAQAAAQIQREMKSISTAGRLSGPLSMAGKGLGAAGAGLGLYDAYRRQHEGDTHGAVVGALGTAASLAPAVVGSAGVLPALGAAAPLYLMAHDRLRYLKEHPEAHQAPEVVNGMRFGPMGEPYGAD